MKIHRGAAPEWMQDLLGLVDGAMVYEYPGGPPGYIWIEPQEDDWPWRISIFPTPGELLEIGPDDGRVLIPGFKLDLRPLIAHFDRLSDLEWYAPSDYKGELDGPCLCLRGSYKRTPVVVCIFDEPPKIVAPTVVFDCIRGETRPIQREEVEGEL